MLIYTLNLCNFYINNCGDNIVRFAQFFGGLTGTTSAPLACTLGRRPAHCMACKAAAPCSGKRPGQKSRRRGSAPFSFLWVPPEAPLEADASLHGPSSAAALRAHVGSPISPATAGRPSRSPAGPQPGGQGPGSTCPFFVHLPGDQGWQWLLK